MRSRSWTRVANSLTSYTSYIGKMFWPTGLVAFYPFPQTVPVASAAAALLALGGVTAFVLLHARRRPYLAVGWCWYLGTLLPVSGLVQVGSHAMADRYTYVPLIGLFLMVAWLVAEWAGPSVRRRIVAAILACAVVVAAAFAARVQAMTWKDTFSLWRHAVAVMPGNYFAHNGLGLELQRQGRTEAAAAHFSEASRLAPGFPNGHNNLGQILAERGHIDEAIAEYRKAIERSPAYLQAHINLGNALRQKGLLDAAVAEVQARSPPVAELRDGMGKSWDRSCSRPGMRGKHSTTPGTRLKYSPTRQLPVSFWPTPSTRRDNPTRPSATMSKRFVSRCR